MICDSLWSFSCRPTVGRSPPPTRLPPLCNCQPLGVDYEIQTLKMYLLTTAWRCVEKVKLLARRTAIRLYEYVCVCVCVCVRARARV
jgi:hypothetical protein